MGSQKRSRAAAGGREETRGRRSRRKKTSTQKFSLLNAKIKIETRKNEKEVSGQLGRVRRSGQSVAGATEAERVVCLLRGCPERTKRKRKKKQKRKIRQLVPKRRNLTKKKAWV